jgi:UbiD family decarboxylase
MHKNLRSFIEALRKKTRSSKSRRRSIRIWRLPKFTAASSKRRARLYCLKTSKGAKYPVVLTFRHDQAHRNRFTKKPQEFRAPRGRDGRNSFAAEAEAAWAFRDMAFRPQVGTKKLKRAPVLEVMDKPANLEELPLLQLWHEDGGHFVTLPLVYTESPTSKKHNLGMYRIQRYDKETTGIHWQIHKGGGFHYHEAEKTNNALPVTIFLGGAPAMILSAIAPLPEDVPELMLASLLADGKIETVENPLTNHHRLLAEAEFAICGHVPPFERRPEGPFGDHYGYYSLVHDYPIFKADAVFSS